MAFQATLLHATGRGVDERSTPIDLRELMKWFGWICLKNGHGLALKLVLGTSVGAPRIAAIQSHLHAGLCFTDSLTGVDREGCRQGERPVCCEIRVGDGYDAVIDSIDELAIEGTHFV